MKPKNILYTKEYGSSSNEYHDDPREVHFMALVEDEKYEEKKKCAPSINNDTSNTQIKSGTLDKYFFSVSFNTPPNPIAEIKLDSQFEEEEAAKVEWERELVSSLDELNNLRRKNKIL